MLNCCGVDSCWNSKVQCRTSCSSVRTMKGRREKSTLFTVSLKIWVPKRSLCARNLSVNSPPRMPSGKPGKFCQGARCRVSTWTVHAEMLAGPAWPAWPYGTCGSIAYVVTCATSHLDIRGGCELPSSCDAVRQPALKEDGLELRPCGIDSRCVCRRAAANNGDWRAELLRRHSCSHKRCKAPVQADTRYQTVPIRNEDAAI